MINEELVLTLDDTEPSPESMKSAEGQPLTFTVQCSGQLPESGKAKLRSTFGGHRRELELKQLSLDQRKDTKDCEWLWNKN